MQNTSSRILFSAAVPATSFWRPGRSWLAGLLLLIGPAAQAQLSGAYTINSSQPTGGTNYASFTAAATALAAAGVSGAVTFSVSGGPYTEQLSLSSFAGASATNRVTFNGNGRTIQFGANTAAQPAVVTLNGADFVTLNNLVVDATAGGTATSAYGWGVEVVNNADNCIISNCTVTASPSSTSTFSAGIVSSGSVADAIAQGATASQNLTITGNTVTGGYYGITAVGQGMVSAGGLNVGLANTPGIVISNNTVRDFYSQGLYIKNLVSPQVSGNDMARPTRPSVGPFYGLNLVACTGAAIEKNRIHNPYTAAPTATSVTYGILINTESSRMSMPNLVSNNLIYNIDGRGDIIALNNGISFSTRYFYNTVLLDNQANTGSGIAYGYGQSAGNLVEFKNNIIQVTRSGSGANYALSLGVGFESDPQEIVSDFNDLVVGSGSNSAIARTSVSYSTLVAWRTATARRPDASSVSVLPQVVSSATGNLQPTASALDGAATPSLFVATDILGVPRHSSTPDIGAYEFSAVLAARSPASADLLQVFPNPSTSGQISWRLAQSSASGKVELLNSLGQLVHTQALTSAKDQVLSTAGLAAGLYTLRLKAGDRVLTTKVVLQ